MLTANLTTNSSNYTVQVRGVEDINSLLKTRRAYVNGTVAKNYTEANVGEILARALSISLRDELSLAVGDRHLKVRVVGIFKSQTQNDVELLIPVGTASMLEGNTNTISIIEFSLKENVNCRRALVQVTQLMVL